MYRRQTLVYYCETLLSIAVLFVYYCERIRVCVSATDAGLLETLLSIVLARHSCRFVYRRQTLCLFVAFTGDRLCVYLWHSLRHADLSLSDPVTVPAFSSARTLPPPPDSHGSRYSVTDNDPPNSMARSGLRPLSPRSLLI